MDRLLRAALRSGPTSRTEDACSGAAELSAFVEGTLTVAERKALETHLSACDRCQAALALLALTPPPTDARQRLSLWPSMIRLRWLVPVATAATAVVVYLAVKPQPAANRGAILSPPQSAVAERQPRANRDIGTAPPSQSPGEARTTTRARTAPVEGREDRPSASADSGASAASPATAVASGPPERKQAAEPDTASAGARAAAMQPARSAPSVTQPAPSAPIPTESAREMSSAAAKLKASGRETDVLSRIVSAPDGSTRWRLGPGGTIDRSVDGGRSWRAQASGSSADLLAGSAPTPTTCWVVGRVGAVLRTADGERWELRPFPERVDLVRIEARDAHTATAIAGDGRRFTTTDGGGTWTSGR
ncbi:MAG: zf-HC2 domain-containing protein [Acidobacteria bacterium]|nr:zf-HC2 domain-containing protein [Acidobacteriota bacterium]